MFGEKPECEIDDINWHLAKENRSGENFNLEKKSPQGYHSEKGGAFLYIPQCAKIQVNFAEISFCSEEVPVEVTNMGSESHIRFKDPISRVIFRIYTLTLCKKGIPVLLI